MKKRRKFDCEFIDMVVELSHYLDDITTLASRNGYTPGSDLPMEKRGRCSSQQFFSIIFTIFMHISLGVEFIILL